MAKKVNFAMANQVSVDMLQSASDAIFAHAMEQTALAKTKKNATVIVEKALKDKYGTIAELNDAIRRDEVEDVALVEAVRTIGRVDYKRSVLSKWYKDKVAEYTAYFRLDDLVGELGANDLEKGVKAMAGILSDIFGLDKVAAATLNKFARRVYAAMDGQKKTGASKTAKGVLLTDRSAREIKEVGVRAMCEYVAKTTNITLKTKEDYNAVFSYDDNLTTIQGFECVEA